MRTPGRSAKPATRAVLVGASWVASLGLVLAFDFILDDFLLHYPNTTLDVYTDLVTGDDCLVCHVPSDEADPGNAYKEDLLANGYDVGALDFVDSDGDGVDNRTEANTTRVDSPTVINGQTQVGYNLGLIDCPDGRLGYDPFSMQVVTGVHETPPQGTVWQNEDPAINCADELDNDCDGLKDSGDPDCSPPPVCTFDADCDDGMFCNGVETCDASRQCQPGTPVNCDDGVGCTADSCDETTDTCVNAPDNAACDDGLFCNGAEVCDPSLHCQTGSPVNCDDGVGCTADSCDETADTCVNAPDDAACDDGLFCNGAEACDPSLDCQARPPVNCDDGVGCTADSCDETADTCVNTPDDAACEDGLFCNGTEVCDPSSDCQAGPPVNCDDGQVCTDDSCNEQVDVCDHVFDPTNGPTCATATCGNSNVEQGEECDDGNTVGGDCCSAACTFESTGSACDDGLFCNTGEVCDGAGTCGGGAPRSCDDGVGCTADSCNETADTCVNTASNAACDDGLFCNGTETCDPSQDCRTGSPIVCDDGVVCTVDSCDESADVCVYAPDDLGCDDGDICTDDTCDPTAGCVNVLDPANDPQCQALCIDQDGDGYSTEGGNCGPVDCNDAVPEINPGAMEACDGLDNDCDGAIDEGLPTRTWYRDADGDGFGSAAQTLTACGNVPPTGYVSDNTDCDDGQASVFPGAPEICQDGLDNDCSGQQDDAVCDNFDSNGDRVVDGTDLAWLGRAFGLCSADPAGEWWYPVDHDRNGCIDGSDLALLSAAWNCRGGENLCQ